MCSNGWSTSRAIARQSHLLWAASSELAKIALPDVGLAPVLALLLLLLLLLLPLLPLLLPLLLLQWQLPLLPRLAASTCSHGFGTARS
jgi:hypothetical protein